MPAQTRERRRSETLSRDASRYKWVDSKDPKPDHNGQTLATKDHAIIQHWAEARGGKPATTTGSGRPRVLRIDFPGYGGDNLRKISWDDWFNVFDERGVTFLFQENLRSGNQSNFSRLTRPAA